MSTTTQSLGDLEHPWKSWDPDPKRKKEIKNMLHKQSKEEIINWLLKKQPSEAEFEDSGRAKTGGG